jgi:hypothetical protein
MARTLRDYTRDTADLVQFWTPRNTKFKDWYNLLSQYDENKTPDLESFVSNDPRTLYNLALFLLTPAVVSYNIPVDGANSVTQDAISQTEKIITQAWDTLETKSYKLGQQGWLHYFNSLMISTGWYSVFCAVDDEKKEFIADIWNPAEVFPDFDDGLSRAVHRYTISASGARKKCRDNGWEVRINGNVPVDVIDYWEYGEGGVPTNTVIIGNQWAKHPTPYPDMYELPVYISPVNGLPDRGSIDSNPFSWKQHMGEAIFGTNEEVYRNYDRQLTFMQQILRDTAQPRIAVHSKSKGVVNESNWNKRGAIYELDIDESIQTVPMPGIPPELSLNLQRIEAMMQRGGFAFSLYSGGEQSGYAQALVSASAQQILNTFRRAASHLLSDVSNAWLLHLRNLNVIPTALPNESKFKIDLRVAIPGDLIQRATTARQLDPNFRISSTTTMDLLFPEIIDPNRELILGRRDEAMMLPEMASLDAIGALTEQAAALQAEGNRQQAQLYLALAASIQQRIQGQSSGAIPAQSPQGPPGQANAGTSGMNTQ